MSEPDWNVDLPPRAVARSCRDLVRHVRVVGADRARADCRAFRSAARFLTEAPVLAGPGPT